MVYAHDPNAPGVRGFSAELQELLRSEMSLEVYDVLLDSDRFGNRENWEQVAAFITNKYRDFASMRWLLTAPWLCSSQSRN